jgi:hypothetical protein
MVWGVCRRILPSHQDAFQATFLVGLRKAASILPVSRLPFPKRHPTCLPKVLTVEQLTTFFAAIREAKSLQAKPIYANNPDLVDYKFLYMHGRSNFTLSPDSGRRAGFSPAGTPVRRA